MPRRIPKITWVIVASILLAVSQALAGRTGSNKQLPTEVKDLAPGLHRLGTARHTVFGFPVFDATLWIVGAQWSPAEAHALDVEASRDVPPTRLVEGLIDEMRDLQVADEWQRSRWKEDLVRVVPALVSGDQLFVLCLPRQGTVLFYNGTERGRISDPNFGAALFRVWLDPMTSRPDFRSALLQY